MKKVLLLLVTAVVVFAGCSKDEELSKTELLCDDDWKLSGFTIAYSYNSVTQTLDVYSNPALLDLPTCLFDDYINFDVDGTFSTKPGINQCNGSLLGSGDWIFTANEAVLSITHYGDTLPTDYTIVTLNESAISLSTIQPVELTDGTNSVFVDGTYKMSFVH